MKHLLTPWILEITLYLGENKNNKIILFEILSRSKVIMWCFYFYFLVITFLGRTTGPKNFV